MLSMIPSVLGGIGPRDLEKIKTIARRAYPRVPQLSTDALAEWMQKVRPALFLVDVRSQQEFAVSHLRGAANLPTVGQIALAVNERKPARTVLYCSVGFRSSRLAHLLAERGLCDVMNLDGSIFQWANEGRAVYRGDVPVQQVHPYGKRWAGLLKEGLSGDS
jgi:rhodanese-related sulfurtransferase